MSITEIPKSLAELQTLEEAFMKRLHEIFFGETGLLEGFLAIMLFTLGMVMLTYGHNMYQFPAFDMMRGVIPYGALGGVMLAISVLKAAALFNGDLHQRVHACAAAGVFWGTFALYVSVGDHQTFLWGCSWVCFTSNIFLVYRRQRDIGDAKAGLDANRARVDELKYKGNLTAIEEIEFRLLSEYVEKRERKAA